MGEWKTYKLCEVANLSTGFPFDGHKYAKEGQRVVRGDNVTIGELRWDTDKDKRWNEPFARAEEFSLQEGDIVIGMDGSRVGRNRAQIKADDLPLLLAQRVACIRHNEKSLQKFLYYQIFSKNFENYIKSVHTGTSIPHVSLKQIGDFSFQVPDLSTQRRIAGILGSLDDKIELNRRINANLEAQAQALFRSWFVDFEPFRDGPFVDSELGKIPQGWKVGTINEILQILSGFAFKSETFTETGPYRLITIKNVQDGNLNIDGAAYLSDIPDKMPQHCNLAIGDILLSLTGNVGRVCIVDRDGLLLNQRVAKLQPKDKRNTFFTYALFRQDSFKQYLIQIAKGTAQLNLSPVETSDIKIVLPNQDILLQFGEIGQPLFDNIISNCKEIITLSALRDTLLPKLMAGEIAIE